MSDTCGTPCLPSDGDVQLHRNNFGVIYSHATTRSTSVYILSSVRIPTHLDPISMHTYQNILPLAAPQLAMVDHLDFWILKRATSAA